MTINFFKHQETIAKNIIIFMRSEGYSKLSLSKLTSISKPDIEQILRSVELNQEIYNSHINKINECFDFPADYFLESQVATVSPHADINICSPNGDESERTVEVQMLFDGLDTILEIYSLYLK